jgi:hypothetical protein
LITLTITGTTVAPVGCWMLSITSLLLLISTEAAVVAPAKAKEAKAIVSNFVFPLIFNVPMLLTLAAVIEVNEVFALTSKEA